MPTTRIKVNHNLTQEEFLKAWWDVAKREKVDGIIMKDVHDKIDTLDNNVNSYLDILYNLDEKVEDVQKEVNHISFQKLDNISQQLEDLKSSQWLIFLTCLALLILTVIILFNHHF